MAENETGVSPTRSNLQSDQNAGSSIFPMYKCYPADDTRFDTNKTATSFPESNRHAVMVALKDLQDRIIQLERERNEALTNLQELTSQPRPAFTSTQNFQTENDQRNDNTVTLADLEAMNAKLDDAEQRCQALNQQLIDLKTNSMERSLTQNTIQSSLKSNPMERTLTQHTIQSSSLKSNPMERSLTQHTIQSSLSSPRQVNANKQQRTGFKSQATSLIEEKEKLSSMRELAEKKIRELECQLQQEKRYQQMIEDKTLLLNRTRSSGSPCKQKNATTFSTGNRLSPKSKRDVSFVTLEGWSRTPDDDVDGLLFELREEMVELDRERHDLLMASRATESPRIAADLEKEIEELNSKMELKEDQIIRVINIQRKECSRNISKSERCSTRDRGLNTTSSHDHYSNTREAVLPLANDDRKVQILTTITACGGASVLGSSVFGSSVLRGLYSYRDADS